MASDFEIDKCLAALEVVYPNHFKAWTTIEQLTTARKLYHRVWRDIDGQLLQAATDQWLSTARPFHPSPGELRDLALTLIKNDFSAEEAWIEVKQAIKTYHVYRAPVFSSALIEKSVKAIGWETLCLQLTSEEPANRAHFMRIYQALENRERQDCLMLPEVKQVIAQLAESKRMQITDGKR